MKKAYADVDAFNPRQDGYGVFAGSLEPALQLAAKASKARRGKVEVSP